MITRIANLSDTAPPWNWLANRFTDDSLSWHACSSYVSKGAAMRLKWPAARVEAALSAKSLLRNHSGPRLLVSHGPLLALYAEALARPPDTQHLVFSFNFTNLPTGVRRTLFRRYLPRASRFVVASSIERELYSKFFDIDSARIDVLLWSIQPPIAELSRPARFSQKPYICAIGSQARDYTTLIESMRRLPAIDLILVASPDSLPQGPIPPNVKILTNVPFSDAMNVLAHSLFMVLPLRDSKVPCGHVTIVAGLHMGKAILATDSSGVHDYLITQKNSLLIPPNDSETLADNIEQLYDNATLRAQFGEQGRAFAQANCTEESAVAYFRKFLTDYCG